MFPSSFRLHVPGKEKNWRTLACSRREGELPVIVGFSEEEENRGCSLGLLVYRKKAPLIEKKQSLPLWFLSVEKKKGELPILNSGANQKLLYSDFWKRKNRSQRGKKKGKKIRRSGGKEGACGRKKKKKRRGQREKMIGMSYTAERTRQVRSSYEPRERTRHHRRRPISSSSGRKKNWAGDEWPLQKVNRSFRGEGGFPAFL